ncbi:sensor domain-containing diguanylate cyclase [Patulibacter sp. SYSU D01012]|uniref:sensor domain-containing diguanylate cyclase n=1 Tax=Patulibacter sp. SYSU D01012 TaxID=2817381 RepID=UPI001FEDCF68|nr:sensor domain-containing diguanylate cyclase [Patulibacter sp. SYSU D01012]
MSTQGREMGEAARLAAVHRYGVLDTPADGAFDRITRMAARIFGVPVAVVSIVDEDRIWFKSVHGLHLHEARRDPGLCASAILQDEPYVVEDTRNDPRTVGNPYVGPDGFGFYAGAPLRAASGERVGTLAIMDCEPRRLDRHETETLEDLAALVVRELELRVSSRRVVAAVHEQLTALEELAVTDPLTKLANRRAFEQRLQEELDAARGTSTAVSVVIADLDRFKGFNDRYGHAVGDRALQVAAEALRSEAADCDLVARFGGEEFVVVLEGCDAEAARAWATRAMDRLRAARVEGADHGVTASFGVASCVACEGPSELLARADAALYRAKRGGRDRVEVAPDEGAPPAAVAPGLAA